MIRRRIITLKLTKRADGMWCKSVGNRLHYFGWAGCTEAEARAELIEFLRARESGVSPAQASDRTILEVGNLYTAECQEKIQRGDMQVRTWTHYQKAIVEVIAEIGGHTFVTAIPPTTWDRIASEWRKHKSANRCNNDIQAVRTMFRWAMLNGIIDRVPLYGSFGKSSPGDVRADRFKRGVVRFFTAGDIKTLLAKSTGQLRAMILLGLNCGMYSVDVADLKWSEVFRDVFPHIRNVRPKTNIPRLAVLWPETVKALDALPRRGERVFTTRIGNIWNNRRGHDAVQQQLRLLMKALGIYRKGIGFGAFRHTHVSAVNDHPDRPACLMVRAHALIGMDAHYDFPSLERIKSVTDLARQRLVPKHPAHRKSAASTSRARGSQRPARRAAKR